MGGFIKVRLAAHAHTFRNLPKKAGAASGRIARSIPFNRFVKDYGVIRVLQVELWRAIVKMQIGLRFFRMTSGSIAVPVGSGRETRSAGDGCTAGDAPMTAAGRGRSVGRGRRAIRTKLGIPNGRIDTVPLTSIMVAGMNRLDPGLRIALPVDIGELAPIHTSPFTRGSFDVPQSILPAPQADSIGVLLSGIGFAWHDGPARPGPIPSSRRPCHPRRMESDRQGH